MNGKKLFVVSIVWMFLVEFAYRTRYIWEDWFWATGAPCTSFGGHPLKPVCFIGDIIWSVYQFDFSWLLIIVSIALWWSQRDKS